MQEILIPFLVFMSVTCLGAAVLAARAARTSPARERLLQKAPEVRLPNPDMAAPPIMRALSKVGTLVGSKKPSSSVREQLVRAGVYDRAFLGVYLGAKMVLLLGGLMALALLTSFVELAPHVQLFLVLAGATLLFFVPNVLLQIRMQSRCREVRNHLPDAVDLLEICVSGGMGLDTAWNAVGDEIRTVTPLLADEMALTSLEIHLGAKRQDAMRHMTDRTGVEEVASLAAVLVQSERFGTSIADALQVFAKTLRDLRSQRAEESAEKMPVKMLFPMVVFIFPVVLIVAIGPACITLYEILIKG